MDIQKLIDEYSTWLKSEITFEKVGEYYEITTPYLDNANDYLQIYVRQIGDEIFFTDDSATIQHLKMSGFSFNSTRNAHLQRILNQFGVTRKDDELICKAPVMSFARRKHLFIQAMLRIDDMFSAPKAKASPIFLDDIQDFFAEKEIFYSDNVQFTGVSGFSHNYDFLLQRSKTKPERFCQAVNTPNRSNMSNILFAWNDTKPSRKADCLLIVILNDQNTVTRGIEDAFKSYNAEVVRWSERNSESNLALFAAS